MSLASQVSVRLSWPCAPPLTPLDDPMANNEHVAILKKGVAANPGVARTRNVKPKLGRAYLSRAYLSQQGVDVDSISPSIAQGCRFGARTHQNILY